MRPLITLSICLVFLFFALIIGVRVYAAATNKPPSPPVFIDTLTPGQPIPPEQKMTCEYPYYGCCSGGAIRQCRPDNTSAAIYFYAASNIIEEVVYIKKYWKIGDLVLAWGTPIGMGTGLYCRAVYWTGGRYAWLCNDPSPESNIYTIWHMQESKMPKVESWRGWRTMDK